jgi:hypothetical protein
MRVKGTIPVGIDILAGALSNEALNARAGKDGRISVNIVVSLEDLLGSNINDLNDLADEKILDLGGSLSDINYKVVGAIPADKDDPGCLNGRVILNVDADVSDLLKEKE